MRRFLIIFILQFAAGDMVFSQANHGINWVQGGPYSKKLSFKNGQPQIATFVNGKYFTQGTSCISDTNGLLRLICDGFRVCDSLGNPIDGGDTIAPRDICNFYDGFSPYSQASIILPLGDDIYAVIVGSVTDSVWNYLWPVSLIDPFDILTYTLVDMKQNNGYGKIVKKMVPLLQGEWLSRSGMMACRHADGKSWWLLKQGKIDNRVYKFIFSPDSVYDYGSQLLPEPIFGNSDSYGQLSFSPNGNEYCYVMATRNVVFRADFDRCSGAISNPRIYHIPVNNQAPSVAVVDTFISGACYSPNGRFLYVNAWYNLYQLDLDEPDTSLAWYHVANMDTTYNQFQNWIVEYMGPDGKIYIGNRNGLGRAWSTIDSPDVKGAGCSFCPKCFRFPNQGVNNPPCMPNYALGKDTTVNCWPMGVGQVKQELPILKVYPNPATSSVTVESEGLRQGRNQLQVYNLMGQMVLQEYFAAPNGKYRVSLRGMAAGVYMLRVNGVVKRLVIE